LGRNAEGVWRNFDPFSGLEGCVTRVGWIDQSFCGFGFKWRESETEVAWSV
jgi:hypothetical protein